MFEIGDYVICGNKGVCRVEDIATLDITGVDKKRKYYIFGKHGLRTGGFRRGFHAQDTAAGGGQESDQPDPSYSASDIYR